MLLIRRQSWRTVIAAWGPRWSRRCRCPWPIELIACAENWNLGCSWGRRGHGGRRRWNIGADLTRRRRYSTWARRRRTWWWSSPELVLKSCMSGRWWRWHSPDHRWWHHWRHYWHHSVWSRRRMGVGRLGRCWRRWVIFRFRIGRDSVKITVANAAPQTALTSPCSVRC